MTLERKTGDTNVPSGNDTSQPSSLSVLSNMFKNTKAQLDIIAEIHKDMEKLQQRAMEAASSKLQEGSKSLPDDVQRRLRLLELEYDSE